MVRISLVSLLSLRVFISSLHLRGWWDSTDNAGTQILDGRYHPQTGFHLLDDMKLRGLEDLESGQLSMID